MPPSQSSNCRPPPVIVVTKPNPNWPNPMNQTKLEDCVKKCHDTFPTTPNPNQSNPCPQGQECRPIGQCNTKPPTKPPTQPDPFEPFEPFPFEPIDPSNPSPSNPTPDPSPSNPCPPGQECRPIGQCPAKPSIEGPCKKEHVAYFSCLQAAMLEPSRYQT